MVEEARLESVYTPKGYREFESLPLRIGKIKGVKRGIALFWSFFFLNNTLLMKKILSILSLLLSTALIIYTAYTGEGESDASTGSLTGKVVSVADGDTFTLLTNNNERVKIRLYAIDAPERGQDFGTKSREFLNDLCYGKMVTIEKKDTDQYGRTLGIAFADGVNLNEEMVRNGLAWYYSHYANDPKLEALEQSARRQRLNIWSMKNPVHPHEFRKNKKNKDK